MRETPTVSLADGLVPSGHMSWIWFYVSTASHLQSKYQKMWVQPALSLCVPVQEKMEMLSLPLSNERRPCVLVGRDNMALPASLISQIGYRCHPSLYTEGDPGEKVELVAGRRSLHPLGGTECLSSLECPSKVFSALRFRCVHDPGSADELPPVCRSQTQGAAQEAAGDIL